MDHPPVLMLGTANPDKAAEFTGLLGDLGLRIVTLAGQHDLPSIEESGDSLAANARLKASRYAEHLGLWVLADDTGLEVDTLGGAPGVRSARYAGPQATAEDNRRKLLADLNGVPLARRDAAFICRLALADPTGEVRAESEGRCRGRIRNGPAGSAGFGYDSLFEIAEYHRTLAEISPVATAILGHRGRAVRAILPQLSQLLCR